MDKEQQKKLIIEIMHNDEKDGLYDHIGDTNKMVTAVRWLEMELVKLESIIGIDGRIYELTEQAKQLEKEQMKKMYNHAMLSLLDTGHGQGFEEYYNETYNK